MSNKRKIIISVIALVISIALLSVSTALAENAVISPFFAIVFIIISLCLVFFSIFFAAKVDYETGIYECRKCGNLFKPTFKAYILGTHTLTTRHLKWPKCKEKSWCKRKISE